MLNAHGDVRGNDYAHVTGFDRVADTRSGHSQLGQARALIDLNHKASVLVETLLGQPLDSRRAAADEQQPNYHENAVFHGVRLSKLPMISNFAFG